MRPKKPVYATFHKAHCFSSSISSEHREGAHRLSVALGGLAAATARNWAYQGNTRDFNALQESASRLLHAK